MNGTIDSETAYQHRVDYTKLRSEMVAAGNYDYVNPAINDWTFPVGQGPLEVEVVIVHPGLSFSEEQVLAELDRRGLRPGTMDELNALAEQHPESINELPILALGSVYVYKQGRWFAHLWDIPGKGYRLDLGDDYYKEFGHGARFLAAPK